MLYVRALRLRCLGDEVRYWRRSRARRAEAVCLVLKRKRRSGCCLAMYEPACQPPDGCIAFLSIPSHLSHILRPASCLSVHPSILRGLPSQSPHQHAGRGQGTYPYQLFHPREPPLPPSFDHAQLCLPLHLGLPHPHRPRLIPLLQRAR